MKAASCPCRAQIRYKAGPPYPDGPATFHTSGPRLEWSVALCVGATRRLHDLVNDVVEVLQGERHGSKMQPFVTFIAMLQLLVTDRRRQMHIAGWFDSQAKHSVCSSNCSRRTDHKRMKCAF
jgi:hypothetical protein